MRLSEMTMEHLAEWCHVQPHDARLPTAWAAAKQAIFGWTALCEDDADQYENLTVAAIGTTGAAIGAGFASALATILTRAAQ